MNYNKILFSICIIAITTLSVFSASPSLFNTLIDNITGNQSSAQVGGIGQKIRTITDGDLRFMNQGNDDSMIGNFFSGYYLDEAYGIFETDYISGQEVQISSQNGTCGDGKSKYELKGYAYNNNFGLVDFTNALGKTNIYACIEDNFGSPDYGTAYFQGYTFSEFIGIQNFDDISFEGYTNIEDTTTDDDGILGRYTKIDGLATSNFKLGTDFNNEVRIIGDINKSLVRKDITQKVYSLIRNITPNNGGGNISGLSSVSWSSTSDGVRLSNNTVLYFGNLAGANVNISGNQIGNKTLVVEGGNVYITGNITGDGMLGIIAMSKNNAGGNIYIDPTVTDIHAVLYTDRSLISYKNGELGGDTLDSQLANQLYVYGSIFSENTLGGGVPSLPDLSYKCPYFVDDASCDVNEAKKYDFNFTRHYRLVSDMSNQTGVDGSGNPVYRQIPDYTGAESMLGDGDSSNNQIQKPGYRKYPFIIEYNSKIQQTPPPFFN